MELTAVVSNADDGKIIFSCGTMMSRSWSETDKLEKLWRGTFLCLPRLVGALLRRILQALIVLTLVLCFHVLLVIVHSMTP